VKAAVIDRGGRILDADDGPDAMESFFVVAEFD
jgi:hypothetical protein